jgi:hypothetical protein
MQLEGISEFLRGFGIMAEDRFSPSQADEKDNVPSSQ